MEEKIICVKQLDKFVRGSIAIVIKYEIKEAQILALVTDSEGMFYVVDLAFFKRGDKL